MPGRPRGTGGKAEELTKDEIKRIDKCLTDTRHEIRNRALFYLGLGSGMRISELVNLRIKDVAPHGAVLNRVVPTRDRTIRVIRRTDARRVRIAGGSATTLDRDEKFFVCTFNETTETLDPILDRDTGLPLRARIETTSRIASTAWLLGQVSPDVDLRGAVLCTSPTASITSLALDRARSSDILAGAAGGSDEREADRPSGGGP